MNLQESIRRILREETDYVKDVRVKISDILKTNRDGQSLDDAIVNVQDGLKSYSEEPPFLLKIGDKYEVLDGFHRIAQKILDGKKYIISDVMIKESNMNLQESIRRILRENSEEKMSNYITKYVNYLLINNKQYCGFEITPPSKNTEVYKYLDSDSKPYSATLYLIGGYDTKYWPRTEAIKDKEFNLVADITLNIKAMFSVTVMIRVEHVKSCDELNGL